MSEDEFDAGAAAAWATGDPPDEPAPLQEESDDGDLQDEDDEEVVDLGGALGAVMSTLVAADERGPTAPTMQDRLDLDEGTAHILDGVIDIVLDLVDVELGDTIGPVGKLAVGASRLGGDGQTSGGQESVDVDAGGGDGLSQEAQEVMAGVDSAS